MNHKLVLAVIAVACGVACSTTASANSPHRRLLSDQPVNTGLGECIDFLIYGSDTLASQANNNPYPFTYSTASYFNRTAGIIYIATYSCASGDTQGAYRVVREVSHEIGHAFSPYDPRTDTRNHWVEDQCVGEARAFGNNVIARDEIFETSGDEVDIEYQGNDAVEPQLLSLFHGSNPPPYAQMGSIFCANNTTGNTGENYNTYYGRLWDEAYGSSSQFLQYADARGDVTTAAKPSNFDMYVFWKTVDEMGANVKTSTSLTVEKWPSRKMVQPNTKRSRPEIVPGGPFVIGSKIPIKESHIVVTKGNEVFRASFTLDSSVCIMSSQIKTQYPEAKITQFPSGHSADEEKYWSVATKNGLVSFGFKESRPECLNDVVFNPGRK